MFMESCVYSWLCLWNTFHYNPSQSEPIEGSKEVCNNLICLYLFNTVFLQLFWTCSSHVATERIKEFESRDKEFPFLFHVSCAILHVPFSLSLDKSPYVVLFFKLGTVVLEDKVVIQVAHSNPGCS